MSKCSNCLHNSVCYMQETCNDIEQQLKDFGCKDFTDCSEWVHLPCNIGKTVYRVMRDKRINKPYEYKVIGFWYSADEQCNNAHLVRYVNGVFESSMSIPFSEFGRIVFLTREEAEKALEEKK